MELRRTEIVESPAADGRVRLVGEVTYDDADVAPEHYWFEVPLEQAGFLSTSGNPWLVCLLPLAVTLGEPLRISRPVDAVLHENARELMHVWKLWYPRLHVVPIEAQIAPGCEGSEPDRTVLFFSGGVDSFFTLLHYDSRAESEGTGKIGDLLWVWGYDVQLDDAAGAAQRCSALEKVASALGKQFVHVTANLRDTRFQRVRWGLLSHGCALGSAALALERRYSRALISASFDYAHLSPWGSHPLTDPLFSTTRTRFIHYGAGFDRAERTEVVAGSEVALNYLHVCNRDTSASNCSTCPKCYETMTDLEACGVLERCLTFRAGTWNAERLAKMYRPRDGRFCLRGTRRLALRRGRPDIAEAIDRCFARSDRVRGLMSVAERVGGWFGRQPLLRRWAGPLKRLLLSNAVTLDQDTLRRLGTHGAQGNGHR